MQIQQTTRRYKLISRLLAKGKLKFLKFTKLPISVMEGEIISLN